MSNIDNDVALKVAEKYADVSGDRQAAFDPQWIFVILDVLNLIRPMLEKCLAAKDVPAMAANPNFIQRRLLKLKVRQILGRRLDRDHGDQLVMAIFETGAEATEKEVQSFLDHE